MKSAPQTKKLNVVGWAPAGGPRTFRLERVQPPRSRHAAYRRLAAVMLGLDVESLAAELQARRLNAHGQRAA